MVNGCPFDQLARSCKSLSCRYKYFISVLLPDPGFPVIQNICVDSPFSHEEKQESSSLSVPKLLDSIHEKVCEWASTISSSLSLIVGKSRACRISVRQLVTTASYSCLS